MDAVETTGVQFQLENHVRWTDWLFHALNLSWVTRTSLVSSLYTTPVCMCVCVYVCEGGSYLTLQAAPPFSLSLSLTACSDLMWSIVRQFVVLVFQQPSVHYHLFSLGVVEGEPKVSSQRDKSTQLEGNVKPYCTPPLCFPVRYVRWKNTVGTYMYWYFCSIQIIISQQMWSINPLGEAGGSSHVSDFLLYKVPCTSHRKEDAP